MALKRTQLAKTSFDHFFSLYFISRLKCIFNVYKKKTVGGLTSLFQVIKYAPGYVYGWSNRANVLIADGDLKGAMADYNRALELADGLNMPDKWVIFLNR